MSFSQCSTSALHSCFGKHSNFTPVAYPDTLWIGVKVKKIGNSSLVHEYTYYSTALKKVVAIGESVLVYLDKLSGQKKPIDVSQKEAIAALESIDQEA